MKRVLATKKKKKWFCSATDNGIHVLVSFFFSHTQEMPVRSAKTISQKRAHVWSPSIEHVSMSCLLATMPNNISTHWTLRCKNSENHDDDTARILVVVVLWCVISFVDFFLGKFYHHRFSHRIFLQTLDDVFVAQRPSMKFLSRK